MIQLLFKIKIFHIYDVLLFFTPMKLLFEEKQYMRQPWLLAITLTPILIPVFTVSFASKVNTTSIQSGTGQIVFIVVMVAFAVLMFCSFYFSKLSTRIYEDKIEYGWNIPTNDMNILYWSDVKSINMINYSFVGYGYRLSTIYGTVYNAKGDIGIQIIKKNGEQLLIGSNKTDELKQNIAFVKSILN